MINRFKKFIPTVFISGYHFFLSLLGALIFRFPSKRLKLIGVTGTNGKTTTAEMIVKILEEARFRVAQISSIKFKIVDREWLNDLPMRMTMPGRFFIQKFLRRAVNQKCQYAVIEVTSEGIKQHRHRFLNFGVAVFTNLSPEHIEAHKGFENYRKMKRKLFQETRQTHILNLDDKNIDYFLKIPAKKKYLYKIKNEITEIKTTTQNALIEAEKHQVSSDGLKFFVNDTEFNLQLLGEFNIYNALAAICMGLSQGIDLETCKKALEKIAIMPGRMEMIIEKPFKVFVDYAFTPNALEKVYQTLTTNYKLQTTKLICVLGATGGGRDRWKRPVLGKIAEKYCDEVIITNEDPYDEDPMEIINQIAEGVGGKARKILDRREAISQSLKVAEEGDLIIITGKGCEPSMCLAGGKKIAWDDRRVAKEEFDKITNSVKVRRF